MNSKNLQLAQNEIDAALEAVEFMERALDESSFSKDNLKENFLKLTSKVQELEDILKDEGIL